LRTRAYDCLVPAVVVVVGQRVAPLACVVVAIQATTTAHLTQSP
jgi:hypothetical protein